MPDIIDESGITVSTLPETVARLTTGMQAIYGADINVDSNSQDGQMINLYAQVAQDIRELAVEIFNSFDPDVARGSVLDQRVTINNIERRGGTFSLISIDIVTDRTVSLQGVDANYDDINAVGFTVQDAVGNRFILVDSETFVAGTYSRNFRAQQLGAVNVPVNTVTQQATVVQGVVSVNNPSALIEIGANEEIDRNLRIRRQRSPSLSSNGFLNGLEAGVGALQNVTDVKAYENVDDIVDANGIPAHGTWLIVEGGANTEIAQVYYSKKSYGSNMKGAVSVNITTPSGGVFVAKFDRPTIENLYVRFDIKRTISTATFDQALIKQLIVSEIAYSIGQFAETSSLTAQAVTAINATGGGGVPINMEISKDGVTWFDFLQTTTLDRKFGLDVSRITITVVS